MTDPLSEVRARHTDARYLAPSDLQVNTLPLKRVALIGSCLLERWGTLVPGHPDCVVDRYINNNIAAMPPLEGERYDFQVVQVALRDLIPEGLLWKIPFNSVEDHQAALERSMRSMELLLRKRMSWNLEYGLLTFVVNFMPPQRNPMGNLLPRFDIRNPEYFVERLNERLELLVRGHKNAFVLDVDRISASLGRRYVQDDSTSVFAHGSLLEMWSPGSRIEPLAPMSDHYELKWIEVFTAAVWEELKALHRSVHQADAVKLVAVDLDDTLWNGVSGDMDEVNVFMAEGWPIGVLEALAFLKRRGVLLAILSKNDESRVREIWPKIYREKLTLDDFAAIKINWRSKVENMRDVLAAMNILPRSVVFVDDNPVEREAMQAAFPDIRVLGRYPYYLRRTLLWAPETQVVSVTEEAGRRTEMMRSQLQREETRGAMTEAEFFANSAPRVTLFSIADAEHPRFARALELINRTNQFNTTGKRWTSTDLDAFLRSGGHLAAFEVSDAFADYGLVGVVLVEGSDIVQWVMSCRVLGYKIENSVMDSVVQWIRGRHSADVAGTLKITDANIPCRDLFARCGFSEVSRSETEFRWHLAASQHVGVYPHVIVSGAI